MSDTNSCQSCSAENPAAATFCGRCGAPLGVSVGCPSCGSANRRGQRFCHVCGTPLEAPGAAPERRHPSIPPSFAAGRYRMKRLLGEGAKKRVYLAHDTTLDRDVAFALIKTEGLDQTGRERVSREAQAMGRLGAHPHIVTVFDLGTEPNSPHPGPLPILGEGEPDGRGQPYMVTELMGGGDVEAAMLLAQATQAREVELRLTVAAIEREE